MKQYLAICLSIFAFASCKTDIDPDDVASVPIADYESWDKIEPLLGPVPGHGDTYRVMFRNERAREYSGAGEYPLGSAVVKEIYGLKGKDGQGSLRYKAVMRRMDKDEHPNLPIMGGWLFTQIDSGTDEFQLDLCWDGCHVNAPHVGAFFDHSY